MQPNTHRVFSLAHNISKTYPIDTLQFREHVDVRKIENKLLINVFILTQKVHIQQHTIHLFLGDNPCLDNLFGQLIEHSLYTGLYVYSSYIGIYTYLKVDLNNTGSIVSGNGRHVRHTSYTIDGALERCYHGFGTNFRIRSCIFCRHSNRWRNNIRKLRNGQLLHSNYP